MDDIDGTIGTEPVRCVQVQLLHKEIGRDVSLQQPGPLPTSQDPHRPWVEQVTMVERGAKKAS